MAKVIKEISMDVSLLNRYRITAKQRDVDSRFLKVKLVDEMIPVNIESTSTVIINAARSDGEVKAFAGEVNEDGTVLVPLTYWMLENDGRLLCDISVIDVDGRRLTTTSFELEVEATVYTGDDISEDEKYDILVALIERCNKITEAETERVANEENRVAAELERIENENKRIQAEALRELASEQSVKSVTDLITLIQKKLADGDFDGKDGEDGFTPTVTATKGDGTVTLTIVGKESTQTVTIDESKFRYAEMHTEYVSGAYVIKDGEGSVQTCESLKEIFRDPDTFLYCVHSNVIHIPSFEEDGAFSFSGTYTIADKAHISRVIINQENVVHTDDTHIEDAANKVTSTRMTEETKNSTEKYPSMKAFTSYVDKEISSQNVEIAKLSDEQSQLSESITEISSDLYDNFFEGSGEDWTTVNIIQKDGFSQWAFNPSTLAVTFQELQATYRSFEPVPVLEGEQYRLVCNNYSSNYFRIYYVVDENYKALSYPTAENGEQTFNIEIPSGAKYIILNQRGTSIPTVLTKKGKAQRTPKEFVNKEVTDALSSEIEGTNGRIDETNDNLEQLEALLRESILVRKEVQDIITIDVSFRDGFGYWSDQKGKVSYITQTGVWLCAEPIDVLPSEHYHLSGKNFNNVYSRAWYVTDANDVILSSSENGTGTVDAEWDIVIPDNGSKLYLTLRNTSGFKSLTKIGEPRTTYVVKKQWEGKKWVCIGDSLTERNSRTTKSYHDYVSESTGIEIVNMGHSGTGYKRHEEDGICFYQRAENIPLDADVITIFGSGNDGGLASSVLGTPTDATTDTVCGCINKTIDVIIGKIPNVSLGIVSPTPWDGSKPDLADNNTMARYTEALRQICKIRSIPFLDLYHCSNLRPWTEEGRQACYTKDEGNGVHPDENGHKLIAPRFKAFLETLIM